MALFGKIYRHLFKTIPKPIFTNSTKFLFGFGEKKACYNPLDNYIFQIPDRCEWGKVYALMEQSYFPDEPSTKSLEAGYAYHPVFEREVFETLEHGYSIVAKCKWTGCIVGAALNFATTDRYPHNLRKFACRVCDERIKHLLLFYAYLQEAPKLFDKYCEDQAFVVRAIVVDRDNRNLNVATTLIKKSLELGKDLGFKLLRVDSSNVAIYQACDIKLNMQWEHDIKYCEYIGLDEKPVFDPFPPNLVVSTFIELPHRLTEADLA